MSVVAESLSDRRDAPRALLEATERSTDILDHGSHGDHQPSGFAAGAAIFDVHAEITASEAVGDRHRRFDGLSDRHRHRDGDRQSEQRGEGSQDEELPAQSVDRGEDAVFRIAQDDGPARTGIARMLGRSRPCLENRLPLEVVCQPPPFTGSVG